ncbi:hypothetical protein BgiBS90_014403, partial [Biomphalaria glabrata]
NLTEINARAVSGLEPQTLCRESYALTPQQVTTARDHQSPTLPLKEAGGLYKTCALQVALQMGPPRCESGDSCLLLTCAIVDTK